MPYARPYGDTYFQVRSTAKAPLESAKLDGEFNALEDFINNNITMTQSTSEWFLENSPVTYLNSTQFRVSGDLTGYYVPYRKIVANLSGSYVFSQVDSSAYSVPNTTVTLKDAVLTASLTQIFYSLVHATAAVTSLQRNFLFPQYVAKTADYTATKYDEIISVAASTVNITISLPSCANLHVGKQYFVKKTDATAYTVIIDPSGSETVDGQATCVLSYQNEAVHLVNNGTNLELIKDIAYRVPTAFLKGAFSKLKLKNNTGTPASKIDISCDSIAIPDTSNVIYNAADVSVTVDCGTTGANGLDTGSLTNDTLYFFYLIANRTTSTTAGLASTSATSPTMPSGYTHKKLVGAVYYTSSAFRTVAQYDRWCYLGNALNMFTCNSASWTSKSCSAFIPSIAVAANIEAKSAGAYAMMMGIAWDGTPTCAVYFYGVNVGALDSYYASACCTYGLKPGSPQTIYCKGADANDRGQVFLHGYELDI